jgi:hypothetical protein
VLAFAYVQALEMLLVHYLLLLLPLLLFVVIALHTVAFNEPFVEETTMEHPNYPLIVRTGLVHSLSEKTQPLDDEYHHLPAFIVGSPDGFSFWCLKSLF